MLPLRSAAVTNCHFLPESTTCGVDPFAWARSGSSDSIRSAGPLDGAGDTSPADDASEIRVAMSYATICALAPGIRLTTPAILSAVRSCSSRPRTCEYSRRGNSTVTLVSACSSMTCRTRSCAALLRLRSRHSTVRNSLASSPGERSPAPSSGPADRIESLEPERAHANGLTPQVVDSGGK